MKNWEQAEKELEELKELRKAISNRIHILQLTIRQHKNNSSATKYLESIAYKMFGKRLKDLTPEEYRIYYNSRQKHNRSKTSKK